MRFNHLSNDKTISHLGLHLGLATGGRHWRLGSGDVSTERSEEYVNILHKAGFSRRLSRGTSTPKYSKNSELNVQSLTARGVLRGPRSWDSPTWCTTSRWVGGGSVCVSAVTCSGLQWFARIKRVGAMPSAETAS